MISFRMLDEVVLRLDAVAAARNVTRSKLMEELLIGALDDEERTIGMMTNPVISQAILGAIAQPEVLRAMSESMRHQLSDEQLELFQKSMHGLEQQIAKHQPTKQRPAVKRYSSKKKKR